MRKLRVAIVGFGFMGQTDALHILKSENMLLVAIIDNNINLINPGGNIKTGNITPDLISSIPYYNTLDDCFANESLDLVYICVHTHAHFKMARKCIENELHVFIEKPFVLNINEGVTLLEEARRRGKKIGVGHVVRFMPAYVVLLDIYRKETFGTLKFISLNRFSGVPDWGDWADRRKEFGSSGGALFDLLIHDIDYLIFMLGKPDHIKCNYTGGYLSEHDYINALWYYDHIDRIVKIEGGNIFPGLFPFEASFKVLFEKAAVSWSSNKACELYIITDKEIRTVFLEDANNGYQEEGAYFAKCIIEDLFPEKCSAESSLETIRECYRHIS